jgi:transposase
MSAVVARYEANMAAAKLRRNGVQLKEIARRMDEEFGVPLSPKAWQMTFDRRGVKIDRERLDSAATDLRAEGNSWEEIAFQMRMRHGCKRTANAWRYRVVGRDS